MKISRFFVLLLAIGIMVAWTVGVTDSLATGKKSQDQQSSSPRSDRDTSTMGSQRGTGGPSDTSTGPRDTSREGMSSTPRDAGGTGSTGPGSTGTGGTGTSGMGSSGGSGTGTSGMGSSSGTGGAGGGEK